MEAKEKLKAHLAKHVQLSDEQFEYVYAHFKPLSLKKGQSLIQPGDIVDAEYFVIDGCLKTYFINDDLKMFILQFAMSTWWASDYAALYSGQPSGIHLDCVTDAEVLVISGADREKICAAIQTVETFFRRRTNNGYVALQKRLLSVMNNNVQQRYEELLKQYPELYNLVPKHLIAAYLGVSRETVSRFHS